MKTNFYYLIAGILAIFFSITHELNGQSSVLPLLSSSPLDINNKVTLSFIWHIITAENFIFGFALLIMAFHKSSEKVRFTAWLICVVMVIRLIVIIVTTFSLRGFDLRDIWIDTIVIILYSTIILLGTMVKMKRVN